MKLAWFLSVCVSVVCVSSHNLLDMTHSFDNSSLYWPNGQAAYHLKILYKGISANGYYWYQGDEVTAGIHLGTHLDAPCHFYKDAWCMAEIPIDRLVERSAVRIDIRQRAALEPDSNVTLDDVRDYEVDHGRIPDGAVVVMCSGWSDKYPDKTAVFGNDRENTSDFHFPAFGLEAVEFLVLERGVYGIAVDTPSFDYGQSEPSYPVHVFTSKYNIYGLENIKDPCLLPPSGATIYIVPTKLVGASGAPARVFATWDSKTGATSHDSVAQPASNIMIVMLVSLCFFM